MHPIAIVIDGIFLALGVAGTTSRHVVNTAQLGIDTV